MPPACRPRQSSASATASRRDPVQGLAQRQVDVEQGHLELGGEEGHQVVAAVALEAADLGQVVGVPHEAGEVLAGDRLLADRRGHQGVGGAGADQGDAGVEGRHGAGGVGGAGVAEGERAAGARPDRARGCRRPRELAERPRAGRRGEPGQAVPGEIGEGRPEGLEGGALGHQQRLPGGGARAPAATSLSRISGPMPGGIPLGEGEDGARGGAQRSASRRRACRGPGPLLQLLFLEHVADARASGSGGWGRWCGSA